jgi:hypothetical protein
MDDEEMLSGPMYASVVRVEKDGREWLDHVVVGTWVRPVVPTWERDGARREREGER